MTACGYDEWNIVDRYGWDDTSRMILIGNSPAELRLSNTITRWLHVVNYWMHSWWFGMEREFNTTSQALIARRHHTMSRCCNNQRTIQCQTFDSEIEASMQPAKLLVWDWHHFLKRSESSVRGASLLRVRDESFHAVQKFDSQTPRNCLLSCNNERWLGSEGIFQGEFKAAATKNQTSDPSMVFVQQSDCTAHGVKKSSEHSEQVRRLKL